MLESLRWLKRRGIAPAHSAAPAVDTVPEETRPSEAVEPPAPESQRLHEVAASEPALRVPPDVSAEAVLGVLRDCVAAGLDNAVSTHLWLVDEASGTLRRVSAVGPGVPAPQPVPLSSEDVLARAEASGRAEFGPVMRLRRPGRPMTLWRYALPVEAGEARGVAAVDIQAEEMPDVSGLPSLTAPLRGSLAGALALHVSHIELETARTLVDATRDLSRLLDPDEVLRVALRRAMELSGAQTGSIMLLDPMSGRLRIAAAEGLGPEIVGNTSLAEGEGIAGWVLSTRQPLLIEDLPMRPASPRGHGVRSAVSVPVADDDGILGVLNVGSRSFPARFTESHLGAVEALGKQTATALRNARAVAESRELYFDTLKALAVALETKDPYSRGGTERVLWYAEAIGAVFGLPEDERDALRIAALLHDIGMNAAGEGVLHSDRPLTTVERALLKMHPQLAAEILAEAPALRQVVPIVYHHHEWYDGEGYLNGVSGESIPLGARILAVADAFVAMTSERPYRGAFSEREALEEISQKAGTQFDPAVCDALRDVLDGGTNRVPGRSSGGL